MVKANLSFHDALSMPIGILSIEYVREVFISCKVFVVACYSIINIKIVNSIPPNPSYHRKKMDITAQY